MKALLSALVVFGMLSSVSAHAAELNSGGMSIEKPWARASAGMARAGAAYMTLVNETDETDKLMRVESDIAKRTEIHTHLMEDGVMKMRKIEGIEVSPGEPTVLRPGGLHVMFMGLHAPLKEGDSFPITLVFENAGEVGAIVSVQGVGSKGDEQGNHNHGHKHTH